MGLNRPGVEPAWVQPAWGSTGMGFNRPGVEPSLYLLLVRYDIGRTNIIFGPREDVRPTVDECLSASTLLIDPKAGYTANRECGRADLRLERTSLIQSPQQLVL